jgi:membrane protease YdiL (CAAX protease family)
MTAASDDSVEDGKQLFRIESTGHRLESITHSFLLVVVAFLVAGLASQGGTSLLQSVGLTEEATPVVAQLVPMSLHFVGLLVAVAVYVDLQDARSLVSIRRPNLREVGWMVGGFVGFAAALVGFDALLSQLGYAPADNVSVEAGREHPRLFLYLIPVVVLLNAPAEELLFRGVVQGLFRRAYGVVPAILAAAAIFGLIHYVALVDSGSRLAYVAIAVVSGLLLGALYEYTDNLVVPIAVHACWNVLVYLSLYVRTAGNPL